MTKSGYNNPSTSKCWKLFRATLTRKASKSGNFFITGNGIQCSWKGIYNSKNHIRLWKKKTSGNSLVVRRVSPGRIIVLSFWTKYVVPHQIKLRILKFIIKRAQSTICTVILCLLGRKWLLSCRFGRTAKFWLPHTDCGCSCRMQGFIYREKKFVPKMFTCKVAAVEWFVYTIICDS